MVPKGHRVTDQTVAPQDEFQITRGKTPGAWKMLLYGTPGSGKSTLASLAPKPFFLDLESGLDRIECDRTPKRLTTLDDVVKWLRWANGRPEYQTIVMDTMDELETMLSKKICSEANKPTLVDIPYGKGGDLLVNEWTRMLNIFDQIRAGGKNVMLIGHETIQKFEDPTTENYDRYTLKIHKKSAPVVTAKMDAVLFARYETIVVEKEDGRGNRATGGKRIIHTVEAPCWVAKNRFGLPPVIEMNKALFEQIT